MSDKIKLSIEIIASIGSFLSGIVMLITMIRVLARLKYNEEVIYKEEAILRYEKIKNTLLLKGIKVEDYEYKGGKNKIIPRLEFEICHYNSITMEPKLKGYKKKVRFIDDKKIVHTWYLK